MVIVYFQWKAKIDLGPLFKLLPSFLINITLVWLGFIHLDPAAVHPRDNYLDAMSHFTGDNVVVITECHKNAICS